ncbi:hypothetical protein BCR33DRAFT_853985 [Rhizoclosmatium globosum]|uniref:C2H2-type domain-containing protein n=1 Tax=Rhizoclosmatium globosum TaxID=329046 RepID=A0A1Y2BV88_9FUNG|nr:hypothetical protein BCR33DRAFT_853985 [Rhizoclosmatium globosum]|eukprot:ORY38680.1 hypothetical protein BCR33DRAFT_853985 [Rhizoclosmatium globosum]
MPTDHHHGDDRHMKVPDCIKAAQRIFWEHTAQSAISPNSPMGSFFTMDMDCFNDMAYFDYSMLLAQFYNQEQKPTCIPDLAHFENRSLLQSFLFDDVSVINGCSTAATSPTTSTTTSLENSLMDSQECLLDSLFIEANLSKEFDASATTPSLTASPTVTFHPSPSYSESEPVLRRTKKSRAKSKRDFLCSFCGNKFIRKQDMQRHEATHEAKKYNCPVAGCGYSFARRDALARHMKSIRCRRRK